MVLPLCHLSTASVSIADASADEGAGDALRRGGRGAGGARLGWDSRSDLAGQQGRALTLLALAERFMHEANPPTKNPERYRQWFRYTMAKHVLPELGMLPVAVVKPGQAEAFRDRKLAAGYKPATVNAMLKAISVLYIWARKQRFTMAQTQPAACASHRPRA